jgi:phosphoribosylformylglycinamidine synthase
LATRSGTTIIHVDFSNAAPALGGSSFAQTRGQLGDRTPDVPDAEYFKTAFNTIQRLIKDQKILAGHDISSGGLITALLEMCFGNSDHGISADLSGYGEKDLVKLLFNENPGVIIQVDDAEGVSDVLKTSNVKYNIIGQVIPSYHIELNNQGQRKDLDIARLRDVWYETSYMLDRKQTEPGHAHLRLKNFHRQELRYYFPKSFGGRLSDYGLTLKRREPGKARAAIIREKGVNGDREMAFIMHLAGFDVKDIHMTDLISGREDLSDVNFIVFVGGFSNSDVLGSAKGWAGAFLYNETAKSALDKFYARNDTLSLGVCNGCQLMMELGLLYPEHDEHPKMLHNDSGKFESAFINVEINENQSVMLKSLAGTRLGIWVAHGEGKFSFPCYRDHYNLVMTYSYEEYPGNPNGSDWATAATCSNDGRHLVMMPHLERSFFPWHWPHYPEERSSDEITPWVEAFVNARKWIGEKTGKSK